jgi:hypothetical protein
MLGEVKKQMTQEVFKCKDVNMKSEDEIPVVKMSKETSPVSWKITEYIKYCALNKIQEFEFI